MPPSNPPKLHLNEHLSPRLAAQLRRYGFDVTSSQGSQTLSDDDSEQLARGFRTTGLLTFNFNDFAALHEQYAADGKEHWGIILSTEESISVLMHRLLRLLNSVSAEELRNQVRWLNEFR